MPVLLLGAAGYSWVAASTRTFSAPAEAATTVPLALMVAAVAMQSRPGLPPILRRVGPREETEKRTAGHSRVRFAVGLWIWGVLISLISVWEVGNLFAGSRHDHPTLSYFLDSMTGHHPMKAALYFLWLIFGVYLLRR